MPLPSIGQDPAMASDSSRGHARQASSSRHPGLSADANITFLPLTPESPETEWRNRLCRVMCFHCVLYLHERRLRAAAASAQRHPIESVQVPICWKCPGDGNPQRNNPVLAHIVRLQLFFFSHYGRNMVIGWVVIGWFLSGDIDALASSYHCVSRPSNRTFIFFPLRFS